MSKLSEIRNGLAENPLGSPVRGPGGFVRREDIQEYTRWSFEEVATPDAEEIRADAELFEQRAQQVREEAFAQAWDAAMADAEQRVQARMDAYVREQDALHARRLADLVGNLVRGLDELQQSLAEQVLELSGEIARQVLRRELAEHPLDSITAVVREAVQMLVDDSGSVRIRLSRADHERLGAAVEAAFPERAIRCVADDSVEPGGCVVEAGGASVDGRLPRRWRNALAALGLSGPWVTVSADER